MKAVHFGAGNIGRGFIGLLLAQAGYEVIFVDVSDELVERLQERREYTVVLASEAQERIVVRGVTAVNGKELERVADMVAQADLVTTAVGVGVLPHIAEGIARGIARKLSGGVGGGIAGRLGGSERSGAGAGGELGYSGGAHYDAGVGGGPLHVIACENAIGASTQLKQHVYARLDAVLHGQADARVAFPDAAVDRIVPLQHHDDPLTVTVEPFHEWVVDRSAMLPGLPPIPGVHYVDRLEPYIERKLFTVNTGHCCAAYFGYLYGCDTIRQSMEDAAIAAKVEAALHETAEMLVRKYGFDRSEHRQYVSRIMERFRNPHLTDEVGRVGRSPLRKLAPNDRLVRPALQLYEYGVMPEHLAEAMAAALLFDYAQDPEAGQLQAAIRANGLSATIAAVTSIPEQHPIHRSAVRHYERLQSVAAAHK